MTRPVLLYDGDCRFCTRCVRALERIGPAAELVAWQVADLGALGVTEAQAAAAVQWIQVDGTVRSGHAAIAAALISAKRVWALAGRLLLLPGISWVAARIYRLVAANRSRLPGTAPSRVRLFSYGTLQLPEVQQATFGRRLDGQVDAVVGFRLETLTIIDPDVIRTSGSSEHPVLVPADDAAAEIEGMVFEITHRELLAADEYEVDDYTRVEVPLRSGKTAWTYVFARIESPLSP